MVADECSVGGRKGVGMNICGVWAVGGLWPHLDTEVDTSGHDNDLACLDRGGGSSGAILKVNRDVTRALPHEGLTW